VSSANEGCGQNQKQENEPKFRGCTVANDFHYKLGCKILIGTSFWPTLRMPFFLKKQKRAFNYKREHGLVKL